MSDDELTAAQQWRFELTSIVLNLAEIDREFAAKLLDALHERVGDAGGAMKLKALNEAIRQVERVM